VSLAARHSYVNYCRAIKSSEALQLIPSRYNLCPRPPLGDSCLVFSLDSWKPSKLEFRFLRTPDVIVARVTVSFFGRQSARPFETILRFDRAYRFHVGSYARRHFE